jgi:hypothetical protein
MFTFNFVLNCVYIDMSNIRMSDTELTELGRFVGQREISVRVVLSVVYETEITLLYCKL